MLARPASLASTSSRRPGETESAFQLNGFRCSETVPRQSGSIRCIPAIGYTFVRAMWAGADDLATDRVSGRAGAWRSAADRRTARRLPRRLAPSPAGHSPSRRRCRAGRHQSRPARRWRGRLPSPPGRACRRPPARWRADAPDRACGAGKLSPPPIARNRSARPRAASRARAIASGLLVQTASRQPASVIARSVLSTSG